MFWFLLFIKVFFYFQLYVVWIAMLLEVTVNIQTNVGK